MSSLPNNETHQNRRDIAGTSPRHRHTKQFFLTARLTQARAVQQGQRSQWDQVADDMVLIQSGLSCRPASRISRLTNRVIVEQRQERSACIVDHCGTERTLPTNTSVGLAWCRANPIWLRSIARLARHARVARATCSWGFARHEYCTTAILPGMLARRHAWLYLDDPSDITAASSAQSTIQDHAISTTRSGSWSTAPFLTLARENGDNVLGWSFRPNAPGIVSDSICHEACLITAPTGGYPSHTPPLRPACQLTMRLNSSRPTGS